MLKAKTSFTEGTLFFKITAFAIPIMLTGLLQVFYNMADKIVVGKFSGDPLALAAVGSVGSLTNLIVNFSMAIAVGGGIVVAQLFGAKLDREVSEATHTSVFFSLFVGVFMAVLGFVIAPSVLRLIGTKPEVLDSAVLYFRITMLGLPSLLIYNFSAAILRSVGDSKTPLLILSSTGILNVLLNMFFVIVCNMTVDGVAIATVISQIASMVLVIQSLRRRKGESYALRFRSLKIHKRQLIKMLQIGIPASLTSLAYGFANVALTGAINTFPTEAITANSIAGSVEGFTYTAMTCFQQAAMTVTGQNFGAKKYDRVRKAYLYSLIQVVAIGIFVGQIQLLFGEPLSMLYIEASDPNKEAVLAYTIDIIKVILSTYFLCGIMEVSAGALRGLGRAGVTMVISLIFACGVRLFYIFVIFFSVDALDTIGELNYAFPISWLSTVLAYLVAIAIVWRRMGIWEKKKKLEDSTVKI